MQSPFTPPVSIIATAYNEQANIVESIRSLLTLHYPRFEVIVVNDGSTDRTLEILTESFGLAARPRGASVPRAMPADPRGLRVDDVSRTSWSWTRRTAAARLTPRTAGSTSRCIPLGRACSTPTRSSTTTPSSGPVLPFLLDPRADGGHRAAASASSTAARSRRRPRDPRQATLASSSHWFRSSSTCAASSSARMGWSRLNALPIISGAFGVFDKRLILRAGGYAPDDSLGGDFEMVIRLHRYIGDHRLPYRLRFVPDPGLLDRGPGDAQVLHGGSGAAWHRGLLDTILRHRPMIGQPALRAPSGSLSLPAFVISEAPRPGGRAARLRRRARSPIPCRHAQRARMGAFVARRVPPQHPGLDPIAVLLDDIVVPASPARPGLLALPRPGQHRGEPRVPSDHGVVAGSRLLRVLARLLGVGSNGATEASATRDAWEARLHRAGGRRAPRARREIDALAAATQALGATSDVGPALGRIAAAALELAARTSPT